MSDAKTQEYYSVVRECYAKAAAVLKTIKERRGPNFGILPGAVEHNIAQVRFKLSQRVALRAGSYGWKGASDPGRIIINLSVCSTPERFKATLLHELAHAVERFAYGKKGHGRTWQSVMRALGEKPETCHSYDLTSTGAEVVATCGCADKKHRIGPRVAKKIAAGSVEYGCRTCRKTIVLLK